MSPVTASTRALQLCLWSRVLTLTSQANFNLPASVSTNIKFTGIALSEISALEKMYLLFLLLTSLGSFPLPKLKCFVCFWTASFGVIIGMVVFTFSAILLINEFPK